MFKQNSPYIFFSAVSEIIFNSTLLTNLSHLDHLTHECYFKPCYYDT